MSQRDYSKLNGRMAELGITQKCMAGAALMTETTMSLKLNGKGFFKQSEIQAMVNLLQIAPEEIGSYFFTPIV